MLAKPAEGNVEGKIVIALYDKTKVIIRYHAAGTLVHFYALAGSLPKI